MSFVLVSCQSHVHRGMSVPYQLDMQGGLRRGGGVAVAWVLILGVVSGIWRDLQDPIPAFNCKL